MVRDKPPKLQRGRCMRALLTFCELWNGRAVFQRRPASSHRMIHIYEVILNCSRAPGTLQGWIVGTRLRF